MKVDSHFYDTTGNLNIDKDLSFKLKDQASFIDMALTKIYSNPQETIVRELISNAIDAQLAIDNKQDIEVHSPTSFEPYFSVKDYGIGMDIFDIENVYSILGESTKTKTNDQIGGFGLGAKSPFAYADSFTIETIKNGERILVLLYKREDGSPALNIVEHTQNDEPSGTTVKVPVKQEDHRKFNKAIKDYSFPLRTIKVKEFKHSDDNILELPKEYFRRLLDPSFFQNPVNNELFEEYFDSFLVLNTKDCPNEIRFAINEISYDSRSFIKRNSVYSLIPIEKRFFQNQNCDFIFYFKTGYLQFNPTRESFIQNKKFDNFCSMASALVDTLFDKISNIVSYFLSQKEQTFFGPEILYESIFNSYQVINERNSSYLSSGIYKLQALRSSNDSGKFRLGKCLEEVAHDKRFSSVNNTGLDIVESGIYKVSSVETKEDLDNYLKNLCSLRLRKAKDLHLCFPNYKHPEVSYSFEMFYPDIILDPLPSVKIEIDRKLNLDEIKELDDEVIKDLFFAPVKPSNIKSIYRKQIITFYSNDTLKEATRLFKTKRYFSSNGEKENFMRGFYKKEDMSDDFSYLVLKNNFMSQYDERLRYFSLFLLITFLNQQDFFERQLKIIFVSTKLYESYKRKRPLYFYFLDETCEDSDFLKDVLLFFESFLQTFLMSTVNNSFLGESKQQKVQDYLNCAGITTSTPNFLGLNDIAPSSTLQQMTPLSHLLLSFIRNSFSFSYQTLQGFDFEYLEEVSTTPNSFLHLPGFIFFFSTCCFFKNLFPSKQSLFATTKDYPELSSLTNFSMNEFEDNPLLIYFTQKSIGLYYSSFFNALLNPINKAS